MEFPLPPTCAQPRRPSQRIGLHRFSAAEFLMALVLLLTAIPFVERLDQGEVIKVLLLTLVLISGVLAVGRRRRTLVCGVVLLLVAVIGKGLNSYWPKLVPAEVYFVAGLAYIVFLIWQFLRYILEAPTVNSEVVCAGISIYLLLGLVWMFAYILVARAIPDAFAFTLGPAASHEMRGDNAFYFSFVTLTTVGYGDIVPVSNVARMLAAMEAITGTLFLAVLIARLVAMYSAERLRPQ